MVSSIHFGRLPKEIGKVFFRKESCSFNTHETKYEFLTIEVMITLLTYIGLYFYGEPY